MTILFTADPHWGHGNVIRFCDRPFKDAEQMDETLIANWNHVVAPDDEVYLLGDVAFSRPKRTVRILERLQGRIYLVEGNHDRSNLKSAVVRDRFEWVRPIHEMWIPDQDVRGNRQKIVLCHYPMLSWNKSHHGSWQLHGHCHGTLPDDPNALRIDVGVDCHGYTPVSYTRVKGIMARKDWRPVDHHGRR